MAIIISGAVIAKAGANVSTNITGTQYMTWISGAEAALNIETRHNWTDAYATMDTDYQNIIGDTISSLAAIPAINFDMSGYTSRTEAQTMLDVNDAISKKNIKTLKDLKSQEFIG